MMLVLHLILKDKFTAASDASYIGRDYLIVDHC